MNLQKKKDLAAKTLGVGRSRITFNNQRLAEIKEAITKQDIRDLTASGAISIKEITGRRVVMKKRLRRRAGSIRKKIKNTKRDYINLTRKLRAYLKDLKRKETITNELFHKLRKEIKASSFPNKEHLKARILAEAELQSKEAKK